MTSAPAPPSPGRRRIVSDPPLIVPLDRLAGVGSVGTRAWIFLLEGGVEGEVLLLQGKQAEASALAGYAGAAEYANQGEPVVVGQRLTQAARRWRFQGYAADSAAVRLCCCARRT
ncbi:MAG TPA: DUF2252 family protein [Actinomycetota bacterium]|jgi:hypothetical protein|nr:DUF2252 family protein [Actinomycetota bacterium]